jgi:hypothetical protein
MDRDGPLPISIGTTSPTDRQWNIHYHVVPFSLKNVLPLFTNVRFFLDIFLKENALDHPEDPFVLSSASVASHVSYWAHNNRSLSSPCVNRLLPR